MNTTWAALVIKEGLINKQKAHDIAYVEADTEAEAVQLIANYDEWPETWWVAGKSTVRIVRIFKVGSEEYMRKLVRTSKPVKVKRRRRRRSA